MASSILGDWNVFVHWGDKQQPSPWASELTFHKNGSWTSNTNSGWWIQLEGMVFFNFPNSYPAGLFYTANATNDTLAGIMGYAFDPNATYPKVPPPGVWWATRPGAPHAARAESAQAADEPSFDVVTGLPDKRADA
jgi:hypothetical protein